MRSLPRLTDSQLGLLVACALVAIACWVLATIEQHLEEHGHCPAYATLSVERAEWDQDDARREGNALGHGCMLSRGSAGDHVRGGRP